MKFITPVLVVTLTVAVVAQQPLPTDSTQPVFRTGADLVLVKGAELMNARQFGRRTRHLRSHPHEVPGGPVGAANAVRTTPMNIEPWGADGRARALFELPLDGVPPGPYVARVVVRDAGETIAELVREVNVLHGVAPATITCSNGVPADSAATMVVNPPPGSSSIVPETCACDGARE